MVAYLRYYTRVCLGGLNKITENFSQTLRSPGRELSYDLPSTKYGLKHSAVTFSEMAESTENISSHAKITKSLGTTLLLRVMSGVQ
jgi:hypothetical protein